MAFVVDVESEESNAFEVIYDRNSPETNDERGMSRNITFIFTFRFLKRYLLCVASFGQI